MLVSLAKPSSHQFGHQDGQRDDRVPFQTEAFAKGDERSYIARVYRWVDQLEQLVEINQYSLLLT